MDDSVTFAVIGCGQMGIRRMEHIEAHPDAELVRVADVNEAKASESGEQFDVPYSTDNDDVIESAVDWVVLSVPNKFHAPIGIKAMEAGKHLFCEKPLAKTPGEGEEMVKAATQNNVQLKVGANLRYFAGVQKAIELIEARKIGDPLFMRGWIGKPGDHVYGSWFENPDMCGGGTLIDNGSHLLDLSRRLLGEVVAGTGYATTLYHDIDVEDNGLGIFEFESDAVAFLQSSWTEWNEYLYAEVYGTDGYVVIDVRLPDEKVTLADRDGYREVFDFTKTDPQSYVAEFDDFMDHIARGECPEPNGFEALRPVQMAHSVYNSNKSLGMQDLWGETERELKSKFQQTVAVSRDD